MHNQIERQNQHSLHSTNLGEISTSGQSQMLPLPLTHGQENKLNFKQNRNEQYGSEDQVKSDSFKSCHSIEGFKMETSKDRLIKRQAKKALKQYQMVSLDKENSYLSGQQVNTILLDVQSKLISCNCCGNYFMLNHKLPKIIPAIFIENINDNRSKAREKYVKQTAYMCVCMLNEGGGCIVTGVKENNLDHKNLQKIPQQQDVNQSIEVTRYFPKQTALFSKSDLQKNIEVVKSFFQEISELICTKNRTKNQFKIIIEPIKFDKYSEGPERIKIKKCWAIRIKIIPLQKDSPYYFYHQLHKNKKQSVVLIRNLKGEICEIKGRSLYEYFGKLKKFNKKLEQSRNNFILNHIDFSVVKAKIVFAQSFGITPYESNTTPILNYDLTILFNIESSKSQSKLQQFLKYLEQRGYYYNLCQPYSKVRYCSLNRILCLNIDMRRAKFQSEKTSLNLPEQLYYVSYALSIRTKNQTDFNKYLKEIQKIVVEEFGENQKCEQLKSQNIMAFGSLQSAILAFVYLKSQEINVSFLKAPNK